MLTEMFFIYVVIQSMNAVFCMRGVVYAFCLIKNHSRMDLFSTNHGDSSISFMPEKRELLYLRWKMAGEKKLPAGKHLHYYHRFLHLQTLYSSKLKWHWAIEGLDNFSFLHVFFFWKTALELSWETKVTVWSNVQWHTGVLRPPLKCSGVQWMHSWTFAWFKKLVLISSMVLKHWIRQAAISNWPVMYYHITEYVRLTSFMFLSFFLLAHTVHTLRTRNDWNLNKTRKY